MSFGFLQATLQLIRTCITSSSLAVLWSRGRLAGFKPYRGLRQSDPLSPFMFVIYLERLSILITKQVECHQWKSFMVCRGALLFRIFFLLMTFLLLPRRMRSKLMWFYL